MIDYLLVSALLVMLIVLALPTIFQLTAILRTTPPMPNRARRLLLRLIIASD